jgi:hypothetical protein
MNFQTSHEISESGSSLGCRQSCQQSCQQSWELLLRLAKGEIDSPLSHALKKLFDENLTKFNT